MAKKTVKNDMTVIHADLPFDQGEEEKAAGAPQSQDTVLAELRAQIAGMQSALEQTKRENMALMTQAPVAQPQLRPTDVKLDDLPDPVSDPKAYGEALVARTRQSIINEQHNQNLQNAAGAASERDLQNLWQDFVEGHPDYADETKVRFIAQELAQKAAQRKRDVNKYMFVTTETFFSDVTKLYDKTFGAPKKDGVVAEEDDDNGSVLDDNRTAGIPGGGPSGRSAAPIDEDKLAGKSMFEGVKSWQQKNGFTI